MSKQARCGDRIGSFMVTRESYVVSGGGQFMSSKEFAIDNRGDGGISFTITGWGDTLDEAENNAVTQAESFFERSNFEIPEASK